MSAYALPGSIFPSISGFAFESTYLMPSSMGESSSQQYEQSTTGPQHDEVTSSPFHFKPVDFSSIESSPIAPNSPLTPARRPVQHQEDEDDGASREVGISVKDAKIDPVRLVKSLTTTSKSRKRDIVPPIPQEVTANSCKVDSSIYEEDNDPHKDAIQFELSISFNGRTYCATRTLPRIIQLRNDLISEISSGRSKALHRMRWIKKCANKAVNNDDDVTVKTVNENDVTIDGSLDCDVKIPELPDYYSAEERSSSGGKFRGFALLHDLLRSYCPVMEGWLLKVTALVPDSPSLSNFLWEPVSGNMMRSTNSFSTLVSIKEDEPEEEYEDEEEYVFAF